MEKPQDYDSTEAVVGGSMGLQAGPHIFKIVSAYEKQSSTGNPMLVLEMDIASGPNAGFYAKLSASKDKPCYQIHRRVTNGNGTAYFKGDILAIEKSNPGFTFNFNEDSLIGKVVGGNLRDEEYQKSNGSIGNFPKIAWLFPKDEIGKQTIPKPKLLPVQAARQPGDDEITDQNLPF